jgi:hypothetical protein
MGINLSHFVRVSALLFVAFILPVKSNDAVALADHLPSYSALTQDAAICKANDDYSGAFNDDLLAVALDPSQGAAVADSLLLLTQNTPANLNLTSLAALPANSMPFDVLMSNTEAGLPGSDDKTIILVPRDSEPAEIDDPVEDWPFARAMYIYTAQGGGQASLLCSIHYQTTDTTGMAEHIGTLLSLLDRVYADRMVVSRADDSYPFHVWLCANAPVSNGGEQWRNNIYFYDISNPRSSIEWIREIAHEFSHLAFQAVGGTYTDPEAFANGYLGERLLVRWLSQGTAGGAVSVESAWKGTFAGYYNFNRLLIAPPLKEFAAYGLNRTKLAERNADGMRYLIGMLLTVDDRCGSAAVGNCLQTIADQHSSDPNLLYDPVSVLLKHTPAGKVHKP